MRVPGAAAAGRHRPRPQPRSRRPPHARLAGQRERHDVPLRAVQGDAGRRTDRHGPGPRPGARAPPADDRRRHDELPPPARPRAVPRHCRRGGRVLPVRCRSHRRADRRGRGAEPGSVRRHRHVHDPQDAARPARRVHPGQGRACQGDRQGRVPRMAGRPARARDRGQGGGVPRGVGAGVSRVRPSDRGERLRAGRRARRTRASGWSPAARTTT